MVRSEGVVQPGFKMKVALFPLDGEERPVRVDEAIVQWARGGEFGMEFLVIRPSQFQRIQQFVMQTLPL